MTARSSKHKTYWVKRHERRYPRAARPSWIAIRLLDTKVLAGGGQWTHLLGNAKLFLKRKLKKAFEFEIESGAVLLYKVA